MRKHILLIAAILCTPAVVVRAASVVPPTTAPAVAPASAQAQSLSPEQSQFFE
ncbi:MAG: hypothetical protein JWN51_1667, partial [Phycisphaerales bacterium]|nr:hypothetical protein [Phycisphaerales bacterium]